MHKSHFDVKNQKMLWGGHSPLIRPHPITLYVYEAAQNILGLRPIKALAWQCVQTPQITVIEYCCYRTGNTENNGSLYLSLKPKFKTLV